MNGQLPNLADFSSSHILSITPPPDSGKPVNVLILLHGLGDTNESMKTLGQRMALPETVCISVRGPTPLPFDIGGFHWGNDIVFDQGSEAMDPDTGFSKSFSYLREILHVLQAECHYNGRNILFFGYGQGGMAALRLAMESEELGGIVSIGGPLSTDVTTPKQKSRTPIIVLGGSSNSSVPESAVKRLKDVFEFVEYKQWRRPSDSPPRNREEMLPIMQFFGRRLQSMQGVPEGSVELL